MSTEIRPELSSVNKYWISKHRYYELKHFCLQYHEWQKYYSKLENSIYHTKSISKIPRGENFENAVENVSIMMAEYSRKMDLIKRVSHEADDVIGDYIFTAVTEDLSFPKIKARLEIPCERDMYYDRYRKFFWLLSKERG